MESIIDTQTLANFINNTHTQNVNHNLVASVSSVEHHIHHHDSIANAGNINFINSHSNMCAMSSDESNNNFIFYYSSTASNNIANKVSKDHEVTKKRERVLHFFSTIYLI